MIRRFYGAPFRDSQIDHFVMAITKKRFSLPNCAKTATHS